MPGTHIAIRTSRTSSPLEIVGQSPTLRFNETDQADPAGRYEIQVNNDIWTIRRAASASWGSFTDLFSIAADPAVGYNGLLSLDRDITNPTNTSTLCGLFIDLSVEETASKRTSLRGIDCTITQADTSTQDLTELTSILATCGPGGTNVTSVQSIYTSGTNRGATVTNWYSIFVESNAVSAGGGSAVNSYGIYIQEPGAGTTLTRAIYVAGSTSEFLSTQTVASAAGATLNAFRLTASTITLSGSTNITTATGFNLVAINAPTYSAANALTISLAATLYISGAPAGGGAGPAAITSAYAIWVDAGNVRLDGDLTFGAAATISTAAGDLTLSPTGNLEISKHVGMGATATATTTATLALSETYTKTDNSNQQSITATVVVQKTSAAYSGYVSGLSIQSAIGATNTQNWTGIPGLVGLSAFARVFTGATGIFAGVAAAELYTYVQAGTATAAYGLYIYNDQGAGTITTQYGIYIQALTRGTSDYGIYIAGADTYAIWVDSGDVRLDANLQMPSGYVSLTEIAAPGAGAADTARIYAIVDGGNLTDLAGVFQDGTVDIFAQEVTPLDAPHLAYGSGTVGRLVIRKPHPGVVKFAMVFPDGREFVLKEIQYHDTELVAANRGAEGPLPSDWLVETAAERLARNGRSV